MEQNRATKADNKAATVLSMPVSDKALLTRIAAGERTAFRLFYLRFHNRVYRFVLRLIHRPEMAEEVVNDVLLTVWRKAASYRGEAAASTWLFGIAYRLALKSLRRWPQPVAEENRPEQVDTAPAPEEQTNQELDARRLRAAMTQLSTEQQAVIELTYFFGYSCAETAAVVACPVNTVKTRLFHARKRLQTVLDAE